MTKSIKAILAEEKDNKTNSNNINRGQPIYYKNELHYIVYEFENNTIISKNKDLSKAFCVVKSNLSIKPTK
jgi:hypothetical protein